MNSRFLLRSAAVAVAMLLAAHSATAQPHVRTVHTFVAWKLYCLSLGLATQTGDEAAAARIREQLGLSANEASLFVVSARNYLQALAVIDREAIAEVLARYPAPLRSLDVTEPAPAGSASGPALPRGPRVRLPRNARSIKEELLRSGYLAQVEARHRAAEAAFTSELRRMLPAPVYTRLDEWVRGQVLPNTRVTDAAGSAPVLDGISRRQR